MPGKQKVESSHRKTATYAFLSGLVAWVARGSDEVVGSGVKLDSEITRVEVSRH